MPITAMTTLRGTLAAVETVLRTRGAADSSPYGEVIQRSCVVLCATAWETYAEDSILWLAERMQESVHADGDGLPATLTVLLAGAEEDLTKRLRAAKRWPDTVTGEDTKAEDLRWIRSLTPPELLAAVLRARVLGPYRLNGERWTGGGMSSPHYDTVGTMQEATYGENFLAQVRLGEEPAGYVADSLTELLAVRNASVHRGETPGPLTRRGARSWVTFVGDLADDLNHRIETWAEEALPLPTHLDPPVGAS